MLTILKYPDSRLKKKSSDIIQVTTSIQDLAKEMFEAMYQDNGIGLAAPQVGELVRLIVMDIPTPDPIDPDKLNPNPIAMINPVIDKRVGEIEYEEGCLSCPELIVKVDRAQTIDVSYLDLDGKPSTTNLSDLDAVCVQHEIDHLNGVLLVDKISRVDKDLYKKKRIRIAKDEDDLAGVL